MCIRDRLTYSLIQYLKISDGKLKFFDSAVRHIFENVGSAFIVGSIISLLWFGGKFKSKIHTKMARIWRLNKNTESSQNTLIEIPILSRAIYDDRIKSSELVLSPVTSFIRKARLVGELFCIVLIFCILLVLLYFLLFNLPSILSIVFKPVVLALVAPIIGIYVFSMFIKY